MNIPYEELIRYIRNECSSDEKKLIENWLAADDNNLNTLIDFQKEWAYVNDKEPIIIPDKNRSWERIKNRTNYTQYQSEYKQQNKKSSIPLTMWAVTSILIVSILVMSVYLINVVHRPLAFTYINTQGGEKSQIILADGTKVWLNSKSEISFANNFDKNSREVKAQGKLFFDVAHNTQKPFVVDIGKVKIRVLGTSFNVTNYEQDNSLEISLLEGKIEVLDAKSDKHLFNLSPDQTARVNKTSLAYEISNEDTQDVKLWTDKKLFIHDAPLSDAIKKLERWYGVKISYSQMDENKRYTFLLNTESLKDFLDLFSKITPIEYEIYDSAITIKGQ